MLTLTQYVEKTTIYIFGQREWVFHDAWGATKKNVDI